MIQTLFLNKTLGTDSFGDQHQSGNLLVLFWSRSNTILGRDSTPFEIDIFRRRSEAILIR